MSSAYECAHRYHQPSRDHGQPAQTPRGAHSAHTLVLGRLGRWRGRSWCCPSWWCCPEAPELFQGRTQSFSKRIHNFTRHAAEGNRPISVGVLQEPADRSPRVGQRIERWVRRHHAGGPRAIREYNSHTSACRVATAAGLAGTALPRSYPIMLAVSYQRAELGINASTLEPQTATSNVFCACCC